MSVIYSLALILFVIICVLLCAVILMQESRTTGLGTSFGGDAGDSLFGTSTADVLKKFTSWLAVIFIGGCIILSLWTSALNPSRANGGASATIQTDQSGQ
jgi:preprotein translocase subunit SecG